MLNSRKAAPICLLDSEPRDVTMAPRLTTMDRIYLAIIASAMLVLGVVGLFVIRTADLMTHARTIGATRFR